MKFKILLLAMFSAFILSACDKKAETAPATTETAPATTETAPATTETAPATTETAPATTETAPATTETAPATTETAPATTETAPAAEEVTEVTEVVETAPAETAANGSVGIPECDDYLNKVMACYEDKLPEASRSALVEALNSQKAQWASLPADQKPALAEGCKQALEASKASLQAYGCSL